ncbi:hypothetical protein [Candidatus Magnetominusculus dajiuhuensis]|uniref:hypothetical protein n=1 Tax=Candidatus Magnetominusculus dajiuhuensis TaxID=3137712 RepID=UPI003B42A677
MSADSDKNIDQFILLTKREQIRKAELLDDKYNPFLEDYLTTVSDYVSTNQEFYAEQIGYHGDMNKNHSFIKFFIKRDSLNYKKPSCVVLKGDVGIGKTTFLEWWQDQDDRYFRSSKININNSESSYHLKNNPYAMYYIHKKMSTDFVHKLSSNTDFRKTLSSNIAKIKDACQCETNYNYEQGFINQSEEFIKLFPDIGYNHLLTCVIRTINTVFGKSVWLLIDNVDKEALDIQEQFIRGGLSTHEAIIEKARSYSWAVSFHVVITLRPETLKCWSFYEKNFQDIKYREPDVLQIAKKTLSKAFDEAASEYELSTSSIEIRSFKFNSAKDLADHIKQRIELCTSWGRWPYDMVANTWHSRLVNWNVRRFIKMWAHFILSDNFFRLWAFKDDEQVSLTTSPFTYIRMLIRGQFNHFVGNTSIDGVGDNPDSPLFFNLFGAPSDLCMDTDKIINNYFIYLRILQYLTTHKRPVLYMTLKNDLKPFYDEDIIDKSVKVLLWARLLEETISGSRNLGDEGNWEKIIIAVNSSIEISPSVDVYFECLLSEYGYIYEMAMVSYQQKNKYHDENSISEDIRKNARKEQYVLAFLLSCHRILIHNLSSYKDNGMIPLFKKNFISPNHLCRPWDSAITACIKALKQKSRASTNGEDRVNALEQIIKEMEILMEYGKNEIRQYIEDIYD